MICYPSGEHKVTADEVACGLLTSDKQDGRSSMSILLATSVRCITIDHRNASSGNAKVENSYLPLMHSLHTQSHTASQSVEYLVRHQIPLLLVPSHSFQNLWQ